MTRGVWLAIGLSLPISIAGQEAARVLDGAGAAYRRIHTLEVEFEQVIDNPMVGGRDVAHGRLYLRTPDRFAMRFSDPEGDLIVADGEWLWLFAPSSTPDQVMRAPVPESGAATPNLFAQFVDRPERRYDATFLDSVALEGRTVDRVRLVPRVEGLAFREAVITVSREDGLIRVLDLTEDTGQRRTLRFTHFLLNRPIDPSIFAFHPPRGVRVVSLNGGP